MKTAFLTLTLLAACASNFAAATPPAPANARNITTLRNFPLGHLRMSISPKLYKSLVISPLTAWVVAQVSSIPGSQPKLVRSDAGGEYDQLALTMAKGWNAVGYNTTESRLHQPTLNVHLLVYKIADGLMAVNFSHNDEAFHASRQYSDIWVGVFKDGKWTRIGGTKVTRQSPEPYR